MTSSCSFKNAKQEINRARQYWTTREGINWIGDNLLTAQSKAEDAWLAAASIDTHGGWLEKHTSFVEAALGDLRSKVNQLTSLNASLEFRLLGDPDDAVEQLPFDEWMMLAEKCINDTEQAIKLLEQDVRRFTE